MILFRYLSRSPRLASMKSLLNLPAYCFSGKGGRAIPGKRRDSKVWSITKCEKRLWTDILTRSSFGPVTDVGEGEWMSSGSGISTQSDVTVGEFGVGKIEVTVYMVYAPDRPDVLFDGECTRTSKTGALARHTGPAGPVSIKCLSASPSPRRLEDLRSSSTASNCEAVVSSFLCDVKVEASSGNGSGVGLPLSRNASAPLVTKVENLFNDLPPRRLWRKLGNINHSPVFCGMMGGSEDCGREMVGGSATAWFRW